MLTSRVAFARVLRPLLVSSADEYVRNVLDVASVAVHCFADVVLDDWHGDFLQHRRQWAVYGEKGQEHPS